jgi:3-dehydroquinate synthase
MKWTVKTNIPVEFDITKIDNIKPYIDSNVGRNIVVVDRTVYDLYPELFKLKSKDAVLVINCQESTKNISLAEQILSFFEQQQVLRRAEPILAIGGGVLLDTVGFCCSIYRRGIPYIRIPTTLLAIVDASVGAKTSINHFDRRNRLGSYYPPRTTIIDRSFIKTQTARDIANGVAEILKLAIVLDLELFELLESSNGLIEAKFQGQDADAIIDRSITGMITALNQNLWERNLQREVDFGHTFSPVIEMKNIETMLHGEAVILDCLFSCCISVNRSLLDYQSLYKIFNVIKKFNLPTQHEDFYNQDLLDLGFKDVIKHRNGNQYLPLPTQIGQCRIVNDVSYREIQEAVNTMRMLNE